MYTRYECRRLIGNGTEAEFLVKLLMNWTVLMQSSSDSLDSVRELGCRIKVLPGKAALYLCYDGSGLLLGTEGAFRVSIGCYDTARSGHLELEISVVWNRVESSKCGSSKQCVIATEEGDDIEDQLFASEVVRGPEDNL